MLAAKLPAFGAVATAVAKGLFLLLPSVEKKELVSCDES